MRCVNVLGSINVGGVDFYGMGLGLLELAVTCGILLHIKLKRKQAQRGNAAAAAALVLPVYAWILYAFAVTQGFGGAIRVTCSVLDDKDDDDTGMPDALCRTLTAGSLAADYVVLTGVTFFLLHHGGGTRAFRHAFLASAAAGTLFFTARVYSLMGWPFAQVVSLAHSVLHTVLYIGVLVLPSSRLYRRPALTRYAAYWALTYLLRSVVLMLLLWEDAVAACILLVNQIVFTGVVQPIVLHNTLRADSHYWQGLLEDGEAGCNAASPLAGSQWDKETALEAASGVDALREGRTPLLHWAFMNLGHDQVLGAGGTSKVFLGSWKRTPCAVKMLFQVELSAATLRAFFSEARLLTSLRHPNVVHVMGVCVMPPALCIIMELCEHGSMYDYLREHHHALDWLQRMQLACDCARAVAYLHAQEPPVLHRDIKSLNFLVNKQGVAKLSDLGESVRAHSVDDAEHNAPHSNWSAPEVLRRQPYTTASDCYSLALVLWEIASGEVPFDDARGVQNAARLRELVCEQRHRPPLPSSWPAPFVQLLRNSWRGNPAKRLCAMQMLEHMEAIMEDSGGAVRTPVGQPLGLLGVTK